MLSFGECCPRKAEAYHDMGISSRNLNIHILIHTSSFALERIDVG